MRSALLPVAATLAVQALMSMATITLPVLAPEAARDVGVPVAYIGLFVALIYATGMASGLVSAGLVHRLGALRVSQLCLLSGAAGLALAASGWLPLLVLGAVLIGCGYGPVTPASSHILSRTAPARHLSMIFSLKQTGVPIGGVLAGTLLPAVALWGSWRASVLLVAMACAACALLIAPLRATLDTDLRPRAPINLGSVGEPLRMMMVNRAGRVLALSSFFFAAIQLCLATYLVAFLTRELGYGLVQAGLMLAAAQAAGIAGRLISGAIADRSGRPTRVLGVMGCIMGLSAAAAAISLASHGPDIVTLLVCAAFGASAIGWNGVFLAEVARQAPPGGVTAATAGALFVTFGGILTGPTVFAFLIEGGMSYRTAFMVIAAPALLCGLLLLWIKPAPPPSPP